MSSDNIFNNTGIIFLQAKDFAGNKLGFPLNDKKVFVMVQGSRCGFCTQAKPDFIKAGKKCTNTVFATIQTDGDESERALSGMLPAITKTQIDGVPTYLLFNNGEFKQIYSGGRDASSIVSFLG